MAERTPDRFQALLLMAVECDDEYEWRYHVVFEALVEALRLGFPAGVRFDPEESRWPVVFIELPTGQVSWHMPEHAHFWDGHSTEEKLRRLRAYCANPTLPAPAVESEP